MTVPVDIHYTAVVSAGVDQLLDDARALGLDPTPKPVPTRRGVSDLLWVVLLVVPVKPFLDSLTQKFADDAYVTLKSFVGKALSRRRAPHDDDQVLMLRDDPTGLEIVLESDLPLAAYRQLFGTDLSALRGTLRYDRSRREWHAEE